MKTAMVAAAVVAMALDVGEAVAVKGGSVGWRAVRQLAATMGEAALGETLAADRPVVDADGTAAESGVSMLAGSNGGDGTAVNAVRVSTVDPEEGLMGQAAPALLRTWRAATL